MATQLQKNLAKAIVENMEADKPKTMKELVVSSGYDMTTAIKQVPAVLEQKGVLEELEKLGFSEHKAKEVVGTIMTDEEEDGNTRLKAADMTFKVHGSYAPEKTVTLEVKTNIKDYEKYQRLAKKYEDELAKELDATT